MSLADALAAWRELLGAEHVTVEGGALAAAETATFRTSQKIPAVIRPADRAQLQACMKVATRHRTPVYPVSAGKNWGYGSRVPPADGCVLIALDRMNRILDFDERLAYVTVEPGVTFAQVGRFLTERGCRLTLGSPGSTPEASLVGNALERGIAGGLDGDRVTRACGMEVVLPDGGCLHTGLRRFEGARAARVFAHGVGPALDGLFAQSNLGVVASMTFWLTPLPEFFQYFSFAINAADKFAGLVERLQAVKRENLIETGIGLYNDYKILTYLRQFPAGREQTRRLDRDAMPPEYLELLRGGVWFGEAALTAPSAEIGELKRRLLCERLGGAVDQLTFQEPGAENPLVGDSSGASPASVYWRKDSPPPADMNPDRDFCGVMWCSPVAPFEAGAVGRCVSIVEETLTAFEFEPVIGAQCLSPRAVHLIASVLYDRRRPGHDAQASACHRSLTQELTRGGFIPYRLGIDAMDALPPSVGDYEDVLRRLKRALDPAGVLAPGRYERRPR